MNLVTVVVVVLLPCVLAVQQLGFYGGDRNGVSTSGISSGACFATQFHVAYSSKVMGVGIMAGVTKNTAENTNSVDPVSNMAGDRVFVFGGTLDTVVAQGSVRKVEDYYAAFDANIQTKYNLNAEHCTPTQSYGNACSYLGTPYINSCNYDAAYEILNHMYGGVTFYEFDQTEFFYTSHPSQSSMDTSGYVYVPSGCDRRFSGCKVHISLHGCNQGKHALGDEYARFTGYNEVAELNDIIIIYPQAISSIALGNPQGCWDWWGYTGVQYASNLAAQMIAVDRILERVLG
ncbi:poly(3-hydroxybutyrate) depolymerase-like [Glandiceps talaboti]